MQDSNNLKYCDVLIEQETTWHDINAHSLSSCRSGLLCNFFDISMSDHVPTDSFQHVHLFTCKLNNLINNYVLEND